MKQKSVQVMPKTFILINEDQDPEEAKRKWLEKLRTRRHIGKSEAEAQIRREFNTIRQGKVMQRTRHKK